MGHGVPGFFLLFLQTEQEKLTRKDGERRKYPSSTSLGQTDRRLRETKSTAQDGRKIMKKRRKSLFQITILFSPSHSHIPPRLHQASDFPAAVHL